MTNKTRIYNTGKAITHKELKDLIKVAQVNGDWSKVERANVSKITNMFCLFTGVEGIENLNLDGWNTSNVTNMGYMFYKSDFNCPLDFDTSNVTNMQSMFSETKYNHPLHFDTSNVEDMESIFDNASITHPITFKGGNIPNDIQAFIDENNITYEEKCKLDGVIHNKCDTNETVVVSSFKL